MSTSELAAKYSKVNDGKPQMKKLGEIKIITGEYEKDGQTKKRYLTIGAMFGTPHHSRLSIKLNATAFSDEKWANVYYDEDCKPNFIDRFDPVSSQPAEPNSRPNNLGAPIESAGLEDIPF